MKQSNLWRLQHPQKRNEWRKRNYSKTQNAKNNYKRWSPDEEELIINSNLTDFELSQQIGRSVQSIQVRRCKLLNIDND